MTKQQQQAVEWLRREILLNDGLGKNHVDRHEYKVFEVTAYEDIKTIFVFARVGRKNDEGTMAEVFARTTRHIAIGPRGGMQLLNSKGKTARGRSVAWALTK